MSEELSDNYDNNPEENYDSLGSYKNKYENAEVKFIQREIQAVTREIEGEKIKLRIADERLQAKKKLYNQLQGKPVQKTDEEKEREHKKKLEENKAHKLEIVSKPKSVNKAEEFRLTQRRQWTKINKQESELESLTKTINETYLKIEDLKFEIDNLRKRRLAYDTQLKKLINNNEELKKYTDELKEVNEKGFQNVEEKDVKILSENREEGTVQNKKFQKERDKLENQYHKIIEANIQRERERIKEQAKRRQMLGIMAKQVMKQSGKKKDAEDTSIEEQIKKLRSEEICDRIPILDLLIEKWKNINKCKKSMLIKYNQNSQVLKKSFDIIMKFLGVEEYEELPIIYQKNEEQTASIQMYICELLNEKSKKEEKKNILLNQIKILDTNKKETTDNKQTFNNNKQANIERLKDQIKNIEDEIKIKRDFFCSLQPMSDKFLNRLNDTYVRDYVPNKIRLNVKYNEHNISNVFDNISNYYKLITELEQSVDYNKTMDNSNKILESLGNDFNSTLDNFTHENILDSKMIKQEHKNAKGDYEQTIRRLAENFINLNNSCGFNTTKTKLKDY